MSRNGGPDAVAQLLGLINAGVISRDFVLERLGITPRTLSRWEHKGPFPRGDNLRAVEELVRSHIRTRTDTARSTERDRAAAYDALAFVFSRMETAGPGDVIRRLLAWVDDEGRSDPPIDRGEDG